MRGLIAVAGIMLCTTLSWGQHSSFTLLGSPSEEGKALPAERRAVHPVSDAYFHEDSFVTTDLRGWYIYHNFPKTIALDGGDANVYALQIRVAITDQLQLVAYKDGYMDWDSGLIQDDGWNDLAAGLKWNFLQNWKDDLHAAVGVGYQFAVGDASILQNDQELRLWASANKGFDKLHLGATVNYLIHTGNEDALGSSDRITWHLHADYYLCKFFSPVVELNGYHSVNDGDNEPLPFSGADVCNLGGGDDLVTAAFGFEVRPIENVALRTAYEMAVTDGDDLYGYRWTFSAIYSF